MDFICKIYKKKKLLCFLFLSFGLRIWFYFSSSDFEKKLNLNAAGLFLRSVCWLLRGIASDVKWLAYVFDSAHTYGIQCSALISGLFKCVQYVTRGLQSLDHLY